VDAYPIPASSGHIGEQRGARATRLPAAIPGPVLLEDAEAEETMSPGAELGGALGLEPATDGDVHGLLDGPRALGAMADVVLNALAVGVDVGDQLAQEAVAFRIVAAGGPQLGQLGDQAVDVALDRLGVKRHENGTALRHEVAR
jgi:hypothetical protein